MKRFTFVFSAILMIFVFAKSNSYSQLPLLVTNSNGITSMQRANGKIFFFKTIDSSGNWVQELWTSNTSVSGATKVISFGTLFSPNGDVKRSIIINNKLFFVLATMVDKEQLWVSDGTKAGTIPLFFTSKIYAFFEFNNLLYFSGYSYTNTAENGVYKSDGTVTGTSLLKNIPSRYTGSIADEGIHNYTLFNNKIFFTVKKGVINNPTAHYSELWSTDGTASGFQRLDSLKGDLRRYAGGQGINIPSQFLREYKGNLYFVFINYVSTNDELWVTNGTPNNAHYFSVAYHPLLEYNGKLILAGGNTSTGTELCTNDGTPGGTTMIKDINTSTPGFLGSKPSNLNISCNKLFFLAVDSGQTDSRIWVTDGTNAGTTLVTPKRGSYYPITKETTGIIYYAFQDNDSVSIFMIDTNTCAPTRLLSWAIADLGRVSQIVQLNPLFMILDGGNAGAQGLYGMGLIAGLNQNKNWSPLKVYPNPAKGQLHFETTEGMSEIRIYDAWGKLIEILHPNNPQESIITVLPGLYFYETTLHSGQRCQGKIVSQ